MTKFNPENKETLTYGECLDPAMKITDPEDAKQYFADYLAFMEKNFEDASGRYTPQEVCKINLGWYAGYYDYETRERVERLFITAHPILRPINS